MDRLLLKPEEAAEVLGIGRTRTYQLLANGGLPGVVRIGKSVRISAEALRRWIAEQTQREGSEPITRRVS
ncbi:MAG: helix-turn-helix domain-containing protein [Chloroflexi bacterium]|nr:helix-turn-helix domain-containing protein [Chloroflexota bacterium]